MLWYQSMVQVYVELGAWLLLVVDVFKITVVVWLYPHINQHLDH